MFGYIGTDDQIDSAGYETDIYWKMLDRDGFRLAPAKGSAQLVADTCLSMMAELGDEGVGRCNRVNAKTTV